MKRLLLFIALLCAVTLSTSSLPSVTSATGAAKKQRAVTKFDQPVMLMGIALKGEYLFVHDDEAMARGEACTYVYKGNAPVHAKLVVAFHCTPTQRGNTEHFIVRSVKTPTGQYQLVEYQFAGSSEGHMVPRSVD